MPQIQSLSKSHFEKEAWGNNQFVCGIDEVGRGPLAGPVVVAAVILPQNTKYRLLKDSKLMSEQEREQAYAWIIKNCHYAVGYSSVHEIDTRNIYQATLHAMRRCLITLLTQHHVPVEQLRYVVIDAMPVQLPQQTINNMVTFHHFPYGESYSPSIAAASIIAKVTRDRLMKQFDLWIPGYEFGAHKGYGTALHQSALITKGQSIIHRKSFVSKATKKPEKLIKEEQQTIF